MEIHFKTNSSSCVLDSFARVAGVEPRHLAEAIGHDGIPQGYHTQELITPMIELGYAVTPIEVYPRATNEQGELWAIDFPQGNLRRFCLSLVNSTGVLTGFNGKGQPHAVAWMKGQIFDSALDHPYDLLCHNNGEPIGFLATCPFRPLCFWKVSRVQG